MKRHLSLFGMSVALMLGAAGCSMSSSPDAYFVIDLYGDYSGMEADAESGNYYTNKATKIGYCYVAKEQKDPSGKDYGKFDLGGVRTYTYSDGGTTTTYDYRASFRTAPHWYEHYTFNSFKGFYSQNVPVDLTHITSNCALFATFDLEYENFPVSVRDPYGDIYLKGQAIVPYGTKILDMPDVKEALLNYPASHDYQADPEDPTTWRDPYYCSYTNDGWYLYLYDKDGKLIESDKDRHITRQIPAGSEADILKALEGLTVEGKMVFEPGYIEEHKEYTVSISYQLRTLNHFDIDTGEAYFDYEPFVPGKNTSGNDLPSSLKVRYNKSIFDEDPKPEEGYGLFDLADYRLTLDGKDGGIDRYDISDPLTPTQIKETYFDGEGNPHERGIMIKRSTIVYDCAITLVYEAAIEYKVRFHGNPADEAAVTETQTISEGDGAHAPTKLTGEAPANKTFVVGEWTETKGSQVAADLSAITHDMDLYPVYVDTLIEDPDNHFVYEFDLYHRGYLLNNVPALTATVVANDFHAALFDEEFPFLGIRSFGDGVKDIEHLALPALVRVAEQAVFTKLDKVIDIDLSATKIESLNAMAFKSLMNLNYIHLPATLTKLGANQFAHCTALLTPPGPGEKRVEIDLTDAAVNGEGGLVATGAFAADWHSGAAVTYLAA